jgi:hypothetical protein
MRQSSVIRHGAKTEYPPPGVMTPTGPVRTIIDKY